jgi:hypothetical protein
MQKKKNSYRWSWFVGMMALLATTMSLRAYPLPYDSAVKVSATVSASAPSITLTWPANAGATSYTISRKAASASSWSQVASVGGSATSWTDSNVAVGSSYEYQIIAACNGFNATGYIYAGVNANLIDSRGKVMLVVDNTYASQLASELTRLQQDLAGDGWTVVRKDFARDTTPPTIKTAIQSEYNKGGLRSVLIFGHIAVAYSGDMRPDGHDNHIGAWASDSYYGDMDGTWTDSSVNNTSAEKPWNWNVPGDGKFDQSTIPSDLELEVGRVDLANMTCFSNKNPSRSELDLLRQYLNKDHNFRHGLLNIERRAVISDNWGNPYGEAFGTAGWRLGAAFFGAQNIEAIAGNTFISNLSSRSALFAWAGGGGSFYSEAFVAGSDDYALNDVKAVFQLHLGSYFGDWDNESAYLRAPLGGTTATLATAWSGRPEWFLHHMALGETIGYGARKTQNNSGIYSPTYTGTRGVHVTLLGDPTLRLHPVLPPSNLQAVAAGSTTTLTWEPSTDSAIQGYHIYCSTSVNGPFTRVSGNLLAAPTFIDTASPAGAIYMVRAVKLETSGSGTYYNASQGIFSTGGGGGSPTAPIAPSNLIATSNGSSSIRLAWSDNSANETGFKVERKVGVAGTYANVTTTGANSASFTDSGLTAGTVYFYRISAVNSVGSSTAVEASASTGTGAPVTASANFVSADAATQGTWKGKYGSEGASVMGDSAALPGYVQVTPRGNSAWTWEYSTTDARAMQRINANDRLASAWYLNGSFTVDLNFTDGQTHRVAMYFVDWDLSNRAQTVEILDTGSGAVLDNQTLSSFQNGKYLIWDLKGAVTVRFTKVSGFNAVLNGLFFGPASTSNSGTTQTTSASLANKNVAVRINGKAGQVFKIYSTSNLSSWTEATTVTLTGTTYDYVDAANLNGGKFYKAVPQ